MRMMCPKCKSKMRVCNSQTDEVNHICYRKHICASCGMIIATTEKVTQLYSTMTELYRVKSLRQMQTEREGE